MSQSDPRPSAAELDDLAREIAERRFGSPAYLVDDEVWDACRAEAEATWTPPAPKSPLQEAIDRARYPDPVEFINAYNAARSGAERPNPDPAPGPLARLRQRIRRGQRA